MNPNVAPAPRCTATITRSDSHVTARCHYPEHHPDSWGHYACLGHDQDGAYVPGNTRPDEEKKR